MEPGSAVTLKKLLIHTDYICICAWCRFVDAFTVAGWLTLKIYVYIMSLTVLSSQRSADRGTQKGNESKMFPFFF